MRRNATGGSSGTESEISEKVSCGSRGFNMIGCSAENRNSTFQDFQSDDKLIQHKKRANVKHWQVEVNYGIILYLSQFMCTPVFYKTKLGLF